MCDAVLQAGTRRGCSPQRKRSSTRRSTSSSGRNGSSAPSGGSSDDLHTAALGPLTSLDASCKSATSRATSALTVDRIQQAYREIVRDIGFSDVTISELQRRAGVPLDALRHWLLEESRAGRVLPTRGDWSLVDADSRAAAIDIAGEPHLRVRFIP